MSKSSFVNPAAVYGPGPGGGASSFEEGLFKPIVLGQRTRLPLLPPGGMGLVYAPGLAQGQLLASERGVPGERYIPCDTHVTVRELAAAVKRIAGQGHVPPTMPIWWAADLRPVERPSRTEPAPTAAPEGAAALLHVEREPGRRQGAPDTGMGAHPPR
jgi:nucleoside-diphosphate-sugar epimerase